MQGSHLKDQQEAQKVEFQHQLEGVGRACRALGKMSAHQCNGGANIIWESNQVNLLVARFKVRQSVF